MSNASSKEFYFERESRSMMPCCHSALSSHRLSPRNQCCVPHSTCCACYCKSLRKFSKSDESNENLQLSFDGRDSQGVRLCMDVSKYKPDELKVRIRGSCLIIEGEHREGGPGKQEYISRRFLRRSSLPKNCDTDNVSCTLTPDGTLCIKAPQKVTDRLVDITIGDF